MNNFWIIKNWKVLSSFLLLLILFPFLVYFYHFCLLEISDEPKDWSDFGNYIGGVLNPIISLLSLVVLSILTWSVSKQSNKENYNLSLKRLRIDILEEFSQNMIKIVEYEAEVYRVMSLIGNLNGSTVISNEGGKLLEKVLKDIEFRTQNISTSRIFFSHVFITKDHLFKYDFMAPVFQSLVNSVELYDTKCLEIMNKIKSIAITDSLNSEDFQNEIATLLDDRQKQFDRFSGLYKLVIPNLKKEVD